MFAEHPQTLQSLIMPLFQPFKTLITGTHRLKRIAFRIIGCNLIQRITHELCR